MSAANAAVYLSADDGHGETFLLTDRSQLDQPTMILSDTDTGKPKLLVKTAEFFAAGYSVDLGNAGPAEGKQRRRRFSRKRGGR